MSSHGAPSNFSAFARSLVNKLEKAKLFCATHTINSTTTDPGVVEVHRITERGADGAFNFVRILPSPSRSWT